MNKILLFYLFSINAMGLFLYGLDKVFSKRKGHRRIPERALLWIARMGGGVGCLLGMLLFRHKTKHIRFKVLVPLWTAIWIALVLMIQNGYFKFLL
jgi:uncharacterized membrane protein YsdA (DUF1294 family)